jgi:hypothetical protein
VDEILARWEKDYGLEAQQERLSRIIEAEKAKRKQQ